MPYITKERREKFDFSVEATSDAIRNLLPEDLGELCSTSGELNYLITTILLGYLNKHGKRYTIMNEIIGVLESAKLEFYRRSMAPYEEKKVKANGDVICRIAKKK